MDSMSYQRSIAKELLAAKDRLRYFINDRHWGEDGRYKEIILKELLRRLLPKTVGVGSGFVCNNSNEMTKQIDIIVYRLDIPLLFGIGDLVIVPECGVLGIIEVKTNMKSCSVLKPVLATARENGEKISRNIFNGVFYFSSSQAACGSSLSEIFGEETGRVNHVCIGESSFIKFWPKLRQPECKAYYSFYKIEELAFGYFFSNLIEHVVNETSGALGLGRELKPFLYPIRETKEAHQEWSADIRE